MPNFAVTFEREVIERATIIAEGSTRDEAIKAAAQIVGEEDYEREEVGPPEIIARQIPDGTLREK